MYRSTGIISWRDHGKHAFLQSMWDAQASSCEHCSTEYIWVIWPGPGTGGGFSPPRSLSLSSREQSSQVPPHCSLGEQKPAGISKACG